MHAYAAGLEQLAVAGLNPFLESLPRGEARGGAGGAGAGAGDRAQSPV